MSVFQYPLNAPGSGITQTLTTSNGTFTCNVNEADNFYLDFDNSTAFTSVYATPTYVGGTSATFTANALSAISLTSLTGGIGTAPQAGDIVIVGFAIGSTADLTFQVSTNGYTSLGELYANDTYDTNLEVSYKIMGATPDTSIDIAVTSGVVADAVAVAVHVWRGIDNVNPLDATPTTATATNTIRPNPPAITTVTPNAEIIIVGASSDATAQTLSAPAGYGDVIQTTSASTNDVAIAIAAASAPTAGAYDSAAFSTASNPSTASAAAFTIALRPGFSYTAPSTATINFENTTGSFKSINVFGNFSTTANPLTRTSMNLSWDSDIIRAPYTSLKSAIAQNDSFMESFLVVNSRVFSNSINAQKIQKTEIITSTQSWTAPFDVSQIDLLICGGGGGSNTKTSANTAGAGSVYTTLLSVSPGTSYTVTIGAGGVGDNGAGSNSTFGSLFTAQGAGTDNLPRGFGGYGAGWDDDAAGDRLEGTLTTGIDGYGDGGTAWSLTGGFAAPANSGRGGNSGTANGGSGVAIIKYWSAL